MSESIDSIDPIKKIERGYSSRSYHIALNKAQQNLQAQLGSKKAIFLAEQQQEQQSQQRLAEQKHKEQQLLDLLDEQVSQDSTMPPNLRKAEAVYLWHDYCYKLCFREKL